MEKDISFELRLCPEGQLTQDYEVGSPSHHPPIPRIGERIAGPDGMPYFWVHEVEYTYVKGFYFTPDILVIARWNKP